MNDKRGRTFQQALAEYEYQKTLAESPAATWSYYREVSPEEFKAVQKYFDGYAERERVRHNMPTGGDVDRYIEWAFNNPDAVKVLVNNGVRYDPTIKMVVETYFRKSHLEKDKVHELVICVLLWERDQARKEENYWKKRAALLLEKVDKPAPLAEGLFDLIFTKMEEWEQRVGVQMRQTDLAEEMQETRETLQTLLNRLKEKKNETQLQATGDNHSDMDSGTTGDT